MHVRSFLKETLWLAAAALAVLAGAAAAAPVTALTAEGPVVGDEARGMKIFKGIPYAEAPVGELRFAPPVPAKVRDRPLQVLDWSPVAVQNLEWPGRTLGENCLTLNIWQPADAAPGAKLPVYVYIHGGGFAAGTGNQDIYDGKSFTEEGIVLVTINYRLGALGFWASQTTLDAYGTTGNWGLLDQIAALKWIKANIAGFAGDPNRITVGGESAGAWSVSALVMSPLAEGLFEQAILQSGSIFGVQSANWYAQGDLKRSIELGRIYAGVLGWADDRAGLDAMRRADARVLAEFSAFRIDATHPSPLFLMPVFDGRVLPENPSQALAAGKFNRVALLWGFNTDEGSIFVPEDTTEERYRMLAVQTLGHDAGLEYVKTHPVTADASAAQRARTLIKESWFTSGMKKTGDALAAAGLPVYAYEWAYVPKQDKACGLGAKHAAEIAYVFGNLPEKAQAREKRLSAAINRRFANFIKTGNPGEAADRWPRYSPADPKVMRFDAERLGTVPLEGVESMEAFARLQERGN